MNRFPYLARRVVRLAAVAMAIAFLVSLTPVFAQDNPTAPIILNGYRLFDVSQSGQYSAEERAEDANRLLKQKVRTTNPPVSVTIIGTQELPIIKVDGYH